jgi:uncharacterized iron-regulated protein
MFAGPRAGLACAMAAAALAALTVAVLNGCAVSVPAPAPAAGFAGKQFVLLGEVHDNAEGQRQRLAELTRAVEQGWRPAIVMEQFDRDQQAAIDRARRERPGDAAYLIAQAGDKAGWAWPQYEPVVALALRHDLPLVAANLSRADAQRIVRDGLDAVFSGTERKQLGLAAPLPGALVSLQSAALDAGHCGNLPKAMLPGMLNAQAARDAVMAAALKPFASRGAVLIAGNGHVRNDVGVPRWLDAPDSAIYSVAWLEDTQLQDASSFDRVMTIRAVRRPDPCKGATPRHAQG